MGRLHRDEHAQGMIELAMVLPIFLLLVCGIIDFGMMFATKVAVTNAVRTGVRYATTHPTAWSNASSAPITTIEGQIQNAGAMASLPNDDSHIVISYLTAAGSSCGRYTASSNSFTGGTQSACVVPGALIQVTVTSQYSLITPIIRKLFPSGVGLSATTTMVEEQ